MNQYIRAFIVASSILVVAHFYLSVMNIDPEIRNYSYETYTLVAPLYFGLINMSGLWLSQKFGLEAYRYLIISIISGLLVAIFATITNSYNFTTKEWLRYYGYIIFKHFLTYNLVIQTLDNLI